MVRTKERYYHRNGLGFKLWANIGWRSATPVLTTRKRVFHTHPFGGHDLSWGDVFSFLCTLKNQSGAVASATGITVVRKAYPKLAGTAGNYLRGLASTYARYQQQLRSPRNPALSILNAMFSDVPASERPSSYYIEGQKFALQILSETLTREPFNLKKLMLYSCLEIELYSEEKTATLPSKPKFTVLRNLCRDFMRDPLGIFLRLRADYIPYDTVEVEDAVVSSDDTAGEFAPLNDE